jgi:hypothetical protein
VALPVIVPGYDLDQVDMVAVSNEDIPSPSKKPVVCPEDEVLVV